jgi:hypothetical protein
MIAVVALALIAVVTTFVTWHCLAVHRVLDRRHNQLQAAWLARSGVELAAARLLDDPAGYNGESVEPIPGAELRIEVRAEPGSADVFRVSSLARVPRDGKDAVPQSVTCTFRRTSRGGEVRLEVVPE